MKKMRCAWAEKGNDELLKQYHDNVWGKPSHDNQELFELLSLELMQSGLSWTTVLHKQVAFEKAFYNFDYHLVAKMDDGDVERLLLDASIIRNRMKINAIIKNAKAIVKLENDGITFNNLVWSFVDNKPINHRIIKQEERPKTTETATNLSKRLKKLGFSFVGPVVAYSFMQASGMVNDHEEKCFVTNDN
ncbi:DNA-3-methyladenine glycosylase I [Fructilactobacillus sp. Tb1]|uniref:DNA-3-methyladenine glycosylase I n=1 Tax=Fructilactobacillus sp. Tb1 TaxID=3422304 RepID=UPI003D2924FA